MRCQRCGRVFEHGAPFCGECGMTRRKAIGALAASLVTVAAAVVAQVCMLCTWVTLRLPFADGETAFSVYDVYRFIKNVGGVVGGVPMIDEWVIGATVCVALMQLSVIAIAVCGVLSTLGKGKALAWLGVLGACGVVGTSLGFLYMIYGLLDHIKSTAVLQAVELTPSAMLTAVTALVALAAWLVRRVLCKTV